MPLLIRRAIVGSVVTVAAVAAGVGAANVLQTHANTEVVVTERLVIHREPGRTITVKGKTIRLPGKIRTRTVTRRVNGRTVTQTLVTTLPGRTVTLPRRVVRVPGETRTTTTTVPGKTRLVVDRRTDTIVRVETTERLATVTAPGVTLPGRRDGRAGRPDPHRDQRPHRHERDNRDRADADRHP